MSEFLVGDRVEVILDECFEKAMIGRIIGVYEAGTMHEEVIYLVKYDGGINTGILLTSELKRI